MAVVVPLVVVGAFLALAYNLELFNGRFHSDLWFALAWGGFPLQADQVVSSIVQQLEGAE